MESNLKLVTSEEFGTVKCDFWQGESDSDFWMTRDQIGEALGYEIPRIAITKIHDRHKDRLDKFSTVTKLGTVEGGRSVVRDIIVYSSKGVYEICRWSRQPKADAFMDWVWNVVDGLRNGSMQLSSSGATLSQDAIISAINKHIDIRMDAIESRIGGNTDTLSDISTDRVRSVISPLIQKYRDITVGGNQTFQKVYARMGVGWQNRQTRYQNNTGLKIARQSYV